MQEVLINQLNFIKEELNQYKTVGVGRNDGKRKENFVLFSIRKTGLMR